MVLIGANGIGKTSVLDVFSLLARSARGELSDAISDLGGLPAIVTYDYAGGLALGISDGRLQYRLRIHLKGRGYSIQDEALGDELERQPGDNPLETSLSQARKLSPDAEHFRQKLASSTYYRVLDVDPRSPVGLPQPLRPAVLPGTNGEELVSCLCHLRETERDRFEAIEDTLRAAFPGFDGLEFPQVAAETLALTWRDKNFSQPFYAHQLSGGMLRFLWLATLLQSTGLTDVTLLDQPEVSLHPDTLSLLGDLFREAARRTPLVIATHSDRLVRHLEPEEMVVMDANVDGSARLTWADKLDLGEWLAEYTLDEAWRRGRMGGRA